MEQCLDTGSPGRRVVEKLRPKPEDYFVLKPKHSAFYSTTLQILLEYLKVRSLVIAGIATDICILVTANDAYMRDYNIVVVRDCVAANTQARTSSALAQIRTVLKGQTPRSVDVRFEGGRLLAPSPPEADTPRRTASRLTGPPRTKSARRRHDP